MNSFPAYITLLYNVNEKSSHLKKKKKIKSLDRIIKALDEATSWEKILYFRSPV